MTGFCNSLLGKDIYDIKENDLINFFKNEQEETNTLEFKSGEVEIHKLCKEICAFLNTEGGLIIIGSPKEKKKKIGKSNYIVCQGELTSSQFPNKDWLYKKINSRITPIPTKLRIQEIKSEKNLCFVIEVNQSFNPPHQLDSEGRYYIRIEREARPAPHGIVDAFFNRRQSPSPKLTTFSRKKNEILDDLFISVSNESKITAENIEGYVQIYGIKNVLNNIDVYKDLISYSNEEYHIRLPSIPYLIKGLSHKANFEIEHYNVPYILKTNIWCKHSLLSSLLIVYSPNEGKDIEIYENEEYANAKFDELKIKFKISIEENNKCDSNCLILNCNSINIEAKKHVGSLILIKNAHTHNPRVFSKYFINLIISDDSGTFFDCFTKVNSKIAKKIYTNPSGDFLGFIQNEPKMYSFVIKDIL